MSLFPAIISGLLLAFAFPPLSWGFLGWAALIPLILTIESAGSRLDAVARSFTAGLVLFLISLQWIAHVAWIAWPLLVLLEASFFALLGWLLYEGTRFEHPLLRSLWTALAWMTCEIIRAEIPIFGFGWNLLAYSQSAQLEILQSASIFGAYGLGFCMALANGLLAKIFEPRRWSSRFGFALIAAAIAVSLFMGGKRMLAQSKPAPSNVRVSVIQGNIPQSVKWEVIARAKILEIYYTLTELASFEQPDLIIWPEAAFPGYFNHDAASPSLEQLIKKLGVPLVFGAPHLVNEQVAYNSAYLMDKEGAVRERYDKQNLVPFGEYVPLKFLFGFLEPIAYSLGVSDFSAGKTPLVFRLFNGEIAFSTLICFEDIFPSLARAFVKQGAEFLVVMTNDAWFGKSAAPYQHLQASILRAVENGVPVVRAANTGVSAFVSSQGNVYARVQDKKGDDIFVMGKQTAFINPSSLPTLYRRGGWTAPYAGAVLLILLLIFAVVRDKIQNRGIAE